MATHPDSNTASCEDPDEGTTVRRTGFGLCLAALILMGVFAVNGEYAYLHPQHEDGLFQLWSDQTGELIGLAIELIVLSPVILVFTHFGSVRADETLARSPGTRASDAANRALSFALSARVALAIAWAWVIYLHRYNWVTVIAAVALFAYSLIGRET